MPGRGRHPASFIRGIHAAEPSPPLRSPSAVMEASGGGYREDASRGGVLLPRRRLSDAHPQHRSPRAASAPLIGPMRFWPRRQRPRSLRSGPAPAAERHPAISMVAASCRRGTTTGSPRHARKDLPSSARELAHGDWRSQTSARPEVLH